MQGLLDDQRRHREHGGRLQLRATPAARVPPAHREPVERARPRGSSDGFFRRPSTPTQFVLYALAQAADGTRSTPQLRTATSSPLRRQRSRLPAWGNFLTDHGCGLVPGLPQVRFGRHARQAKRRALHFRRRTSRALTFSGSSPTSTGCPPRLTARACAVCMGTRYRHAYDGFDRFVESVAASQLWIAMPAAAGPLTGFRAASQLRDRDARFRGCVCSDR